MALYVALVLSVLALPAAASAAAPSGLFTDDVNAAAGSTRPVNIASQTPHFSFLNGLGTVVDRQRTQVANDPFDPPVALWHLDAGGLTADASGNGNALTVQGAPPTQTPGLADFGTAAVFTPTGGELKAFANAAYDAPSSFTVDLWFRTTTIADSPFPTMLSKMGPTGQLPTNYVLQFERSTNSLMFEVTSGGNAANLGSISVPATPFLDGAWHHVAGVFTGTQIILYADGTARTSMAFSGPLDTDGVPIVGNDGVSSNRFNGSIDEVRLLGRAASAAEILGYYRSSRPHNTLLWDSDPADVGAAMPACANATRCSDVVYGGSPGTLAVPGRYYVQQKHRLASNTWSAWSSSDWFETAKVAPFAPISLAQFRTDGTTAIPDGGWTQNGISNDVVLRFSASDANWSETLTPYVELRDVGDPWGPAACGTVSPGAVYSGTAVPAPVGRTPVNFTVRATGLQDGGQYHWRACVKDVSGQASPWVELGGTPDFTIDATAPAAPATPDDGAAADIDVQQSLTQLQASFAPPSDGGGSGVLDYDWCFTTAPGSNCVSGTVGTVATGQTLLTAQRTGLALVDGTLYSFCVRARDGAGNVSGYTCSNGVTPDSTAPSTVATARDGVATDIAWQRTTGQLDANFTAAGDGTGSGVTGYDWCFTTSAGSSCVAGVVGAVADNDPGLTAQRTSAGLTPGATYYFCVRAQDLAGNEGAWTCSNGVTIDTAVPTAPSGHADGTSADIDWQNGVSKLDANFTAGADTDSGVSGYDWCFTTVAGGDCTTGTLGAVADNAPGVTAQRIVALADGSTYYFCVRTQDTAGNEGTWGCSDGVTVDATPLTMLAPTDGVTPPDTDWQSDTTSLAASWSAPAAGGAPLVDYDYCFVAGTPTGCAAPLTPGMNASGTATATTQAATSLLLTSGSLYGACVRARDAAGNLSAWACSDGVTIDATAPTVATPVDGPTAGLDIDLQTSQSVLTTTWSAPAAGGSPIQGYDHCFVAAGAGGCAAPIAGTNTSGSGTSVTQTASGLTLVDGTAYSACVRALDTAGNVGAWSCSDGVTIDVTAPTVPSSPKDGTGSDIDWQSGLTTLDGSFTGSSDGTGSGVTGYDWCFTTVAGGNCTAGTIGAVADDAPGLTAQRASLALAAGSTYFFCVRAQDAAGNESAWACSDGVTVDTTPLTMPGPADGATAPDVDWQNDPTSLSANWSVPAAGGAPLVDYDYCFGSASATDCNSPVTPGTNVSGTTTTTVQTATSLLLAPGASYAACVRARDAAGNVSSWACSDGATIDVTAPSMAAPTDGPGADIDIQTSQTTLTGTWSAPGASGAPVQGYDHCFTPAGSGTCAAPLAGTNTTGSGTALTQSATSLVLLDGGSYSACVRVHDEAGNVGAWSCSDGVVVDVTAPTAPTVRTDGTGPDIDWQSSTSVLDASFGGASDGAGTGVTGHDWCFTTDVAGGCTTGVVGAVADNAAGLTAQRASLALAAGGTYSFCVRAQDAAGNESAWTCSDGVTVDTTALTMSAPRDGAASPDVDWQNDASSLSANWTAPAAGGAPLVDYDHCFVANGATGCTAPITPGTNVSGTGTSTTQTATSLLLTPGGSYGSCVRARDAAGNVSAWACSDGITIDSTAPTLLAPQDGPSGDIDVQTSQTTLSATWPAPAASGAPVQSYDHCFVPTGASSCSTPLAGANTSGSGAALTQTATSLALADGGSYGACVRVHDEAGNVSAWSCSDGVVVDVTAPTSPSVRNDGTGPDIDWQSSTTQLDASFAAGTDGAGSGVSGYDWCFTTVAGGDCTAGTIGAVADDASGLTAQRGPVTLTVGTTYAFCVRAQDLAGNEGAWSCSDGVTIDTTAPSMSTPDDGSTSPDLDWQNDATALAVNWTAPAAGGAPLVDYEYCFVSGAASDCSTPLTPGTNTSGTGTARTQAAAGLALTPGTSYGACVRDRDEAGNVSAWACSDGVTVDTTPITMPAPTDGPGADLDWQASQTTLQSTWTAPTVTGAPIEAYDHCFVTAGAADCSSPLAGTNTSGSSTALTQTATGLTLADGASYRSCVRARDAAGNTSPWSCTDAVTVDAAAPAPPSSRNDGMSADIDWQGSTTQLDASFAAAADGAGSGVSGYDWCFASAPAGDCTSGTVGTVADDAPGLTAQRSALTLTTGSAYTFCVRAQDSVGNEGAWACSDGVTVDTVPLSMPVPDDGAAAPDVDWQNDTATLTTSWAAPAAGGAPLVDYEHCFVAGGASDCSSPLAPGTNSSGTGTSRTQTATALTLTAGNSYGACVRATDAAGNASAWACSDGVAIDTAPVTMPTPANGSSTDVDWQNSQTTLQSSWTAPTVVGAPIVDYDYCFAAGGAIDCSTPLAGTNAAGTGTALTQTATGLSLPDGGTFTTCVRGRDAAGNTSAWACADGVTVDATVPVAPTLSADGSGTDTDWQSSLTQLDATFTPSSDTSGSGAAGSDWCFTTIATNGCGPLGVVGSGTGLTATSAQLTSLALVDGATYYLCVRSRDVAGNTSAYSCSDGVTVDATAPALPAPSDGPGADLDVQESATQLDANFAGATDAGSGVADHDWCFSTDPSGDCTTSLIGTAVTHQVGTTAQLSGLTLTVGTTYRACVRARDKLGNVGPYSCSDGVQVAAPAPPPTAPVDVVQQPIVVAENVGVEVDQRDGVSVSEARPADTDTVAVVLRSRPVADVTVGIVPDGEVRASATAGEQSLVFTPSDWNIPRDVTVAAAADDDDEPSPHAGRISFPVTSADSRYAALPASAVNVQVADDDTAALVLVGTATPPPVLTEGGAARQLRVRLSTRPAGNVDVALHADKQVTTTDAALRFTRANWDTAQVVEIAARDDSVVEEDRIGVVTLTATSTDASYRALTASTVRYSVVDDDAVDRAPRDTGVPTTAPPATQPERDATPGPGPAPTPTSGGTSPAPRTGSTPRPTPPSPPARPRTTSRDDASPSTPARQETTEEHPRKGSAASAQTDAKPTARGGIRGWAGRHKKTSAAAGLGASAVATAIGVKSLGAVGAKTMTGAAKGMNWNWLLDRIRQMNHVRKLVRRQRKRSLMRRALDRLLRRTRDEDEEGDDVAADDGIAVDLDPPDRMAA